VALAGELVMDPVAEPAAVVTGPAAVVAVLAVVVAGLVAVLAVVVADLVAVLPEPVLAAVLAGELVMDPVAEPAAVVAEPAAEEADVGEVAACACREKSNKTAKIPAAKSASCTARRPMWRKIGSGTSCSRPVGRGRVRGTSRHKQPETSTPGLSRYWCDEDAGFPVLDAEPWAQFWSPLRPQPFTGQLRTRCRPGHVRSRCSRGA
jgi:hypothetical protein